LHAIIHRCALLPGWGVNLRAAFFIITASLPPLRAAATADDPVRVINIGSISGITQSPSSDNAGYGASRVGLHHLSTYLAAEFGPEHIR
jgi:NAD(P)-dependent dehydrogenase (short-subunit alcohol dehydrogenase family)